jgi:hypothetical protein
MIRVNENIKIDVDNKQYIVKEIGTVQDKKSKNFGQPYETIYGFYSSLESALENGVTKILVNKKLNEKEYSIRQAVEEIRNIKNEIVKLAK